MTEYQTLLGKRALACKGWRWLQGMTARGVGEHEEDNAECLYVLGSDGDPNPFFFLKDPLPDFSDPATLGCLLFLVREAWKDPNTYCFLSLVTASWCTTGKGILSSLEYPIESYISEVDSLVTALERAPG